MTDVAVLSSPAALSPGLAGRAVGVLTSPRATYASVAARPRILGMLLLTIGLSVVPMTIFFTTEVGQNALLDMQVERLESFGVTINDQMYSNMQRQTRLAPYFQAAGSLVFVPVLTAITAGLIIAIFNAGFGGNATFKQVMAVVAHAGMVPALHPLLTMPLNYVRESMSSATNLAIFTPFLDDSSFPARALGTIDLIYIWWLINLAIGVGVLYTKRTAPIAWGFLAAYLVIALAIAAVISAVSGA